MSPRSLSSSAILPLAATLAIAACAPATAAPPVTPVAKRPAPRPASPGPTSALLPPSLAVRVVFDGVEGAEAARARDAFAPVSPRLAECQRGNGVIRLKLVSSRGGSRVTVEPETTLDGRARRCVLETLSVIEMEGFSGDTSAAARPSGFSALLRIEW